MKRRRDALRVAVVLLLFLVVIAGVDSRLKTVTYEIVSDEVESPVTLAVLADLHGCSYGEGQRELLDAVSKVQPDAVLMLGDIVDDVMPEKNAWTTVSALSEEYPCYYVTGNHEWRTDAERICDEMSELGITVLRGDCTELVVGEMVLTLCGLDDPDAGLWQEQWERLEETVEGDAFTVLLSHRPERVEDYESLGTDLVVAGHAHGGQWRIPGVLNGLLAPHQGLFPPYAGGMYPLEETTMVVSRGLARESTLVPRIFNRPEMVLIDLLGE